MAKMSFPSLNNVSIKNMPHEVTHDIGGLITKSVILCVEQEGTSKCTVCTQ